MKSLASDSIPQCNVISHYVCGHNIQVQTDHVPSYLIRVELTIDFDLILHEPIMYRSSIVSSQQTLRFGFNDLLDCNQIDLLLAPVLTSLGINTSSTEGETILREIRSLRVGIVTDIFRRGSYCKYLSLHSMIMATESEIEYEVLMMMTTSALDESTSEFEGSNYGMVAATESSMNEMLKKVRIQEDEDEEKCCTICLEELEVGFGGSRMPCSHTFHGDCIQICRYEMPTQMKREI